MLIFLGIPAILILAHLAYKSGIQNRFGVLEKSSKIDKQLDLYGGLWAKIYFSYRLWTDFLNSEGYNFPDEYSAFKDAVNSSPQSVISKRYRSIVRDLWKPSQYEILDILENNFALFGAEEFMSTPLLEYIAYITSYKLIIYRWEADDFSYHFPDQKFPTSLLYFLEEKIM